MAVVEVLPWHAGNRHLGMILHQLGQHLPPAQDLKPRARPQRVRVVLFHRSRMNHDVGRAQVFGPVAQVDAHSQPRQPPGDGAFGQIRAAHPVPLAHQQLRQAAHADAADADEVVG